ncbi:MAG TPA: hypothetical protein DCX54_03035 [Flavobacteriales bacterium]|nr:hypothetical protein [Flavobacteriales bacterium]
MRMNFHKMLWLGILVSFISSAGKPVERKQEILSIINVNDNQWQSFVYDAQLYENRIDTLRKVRFWTMVMNTSEDMVILNQANNRRIFHVLPFQDWDKLSEEDQLEYRNVLRNEFCLDSNERIFATRGKSEFYQFRKVMPSIDKGIEVFIDNGVDPWYAQTILLIESPGHTTKSPTGALGSFQLMPKVARKFGLRVDSKLDERFNFERSAYGSSQLLKFICIPYARQMLDERGFEYAESDISFRLLVLHIYHAGAYNVKNALVKIDQNVRGMDLIQKLWETEAKGFRNASQNYSQVALASIIQLNDLIHEQCVIYNVTEIPMIKSVLMDDSEQVSVTE